MLWLLVFFNELVCSWLVILSLKENCLLDCLLESEFFFDLWDVVVVLDVDYMIIIMNDLNDCNLI